MQNSYTELVFTINNGEDYVSDILISELAQIGFDTFESTEDGFRAYISSGDFDETLLQSALSEYKDQFTFEYKTNIIPYKNWNEVWESNFEPVIIGGKIYIRANFHEERKEYPHQILMHPKMAFGTGHHETTFQMAEKMLDIDMKNKSVLDMGCGTGILAILAFQQGASRILAIDNDPIAAESCEENFQLNHVENATATCGDADTIQGMHFDIILANINRNILLRDMKAYSDSLVSGGTILFSGFYTQDLDAIKQEALKNDIIYTTHQSKNNWVVALFQKI